MRMTKLNQFFRDAGAALTRSPEVRQAVSQATHQLETKLAKSVSRSVERFADRFENAKPKVAAPVAVGRGETDFVKGLYRELLNREPDLEGFNAHMAGLARGVSREEIRQTFLNSPEYAEKQAAPVNVPAPVTPPTAPVPPPAPTVTLVEPGAPLRTVPLRPEYAEANIDKSSPEAAALSAARWARSKYSELFTRAEDRNVCAEIMTHVIGALRVAGYDAHRVVNHASMNDGARWGSDAVVLNGNVFDVYRAMGQEAAPVAQNMGPYAAGRLRE
ncbi:MAG: DUF4214 domain-containing protein [Archangium sp.]|nr:DUF4214 domain-containing protein [Archangium sp.]MDP3154320.1 DUF4214 domain-containing protein [Archangium sp.]MDP3569734.1 DUF4214 domain-containing protein [Archangium sp.]